MISWLLFEAGHQVPSTRKEAVESFVEYLWQKFSLKQERLFELKHSHNFSDCCRKNYRQQSYYGSFTEACPKCHTPWNEKPKFSPSLWLDFVASFHSLDCDKFGDDGFYSESFPNPYGWNPWHYNFDAEPGTVVVVPENAAELFMIVLKSLHPEIEVDPDDYGTEDWEDIGDQDNYLLKDLENLYDENKVYLDGCYTSPSVSEFDAEPSE